MRPPTNDHGIANAESMKLNIGKEFNRCTKPTFLKRLLSMILDGNKVILLLTWVFAICGAGFLTLTFDGKSRQFFGIAGSREQSISFQYPVEIMHIAVVEGEEVEQRTTLMKARRHDLASEQAIIEDNIDEITSRQREYLAASRAELESLRAQQQTKLVEIDTQIQSLESQYKLNINLMKDISGISVNPGNNNFSPLLTEVIGLKEKRRHVKMSLQAQIDNIQEQLKTDIRPADAQIAELKKRKVELQRQAADLNVYAKFDGSIGSVLYKPGEQVPPFEPILTLYSSSPSYTKGFIHEELLNEVKVGQSVWVKSKCAVNEKQCVRGVVESLGSRIVEYPERLKVNPMVAAWGREAIIHLEDQNPFLLGEKILISLEKPKTIRERIDSTADSIADTYAGMGTPKSFGEWVDSIAGIIADSYTGIDKSYLIRKWIDPIADIFLRSYTELANVIPIRNTEPISTPLIDIGSTRIEASGVAWDNVTDTYLLVSDETMKSGPMVYEMNKQGQLLSALPINVAGDIDDMESISTDGKYFYVASSLSYSKKGRLESKRRKLVRLQRTGKNLETRGEVDLYEILRSLADNTTVDVAAREYLKQAIEHKSLDIEAHAVMNNLLYLGFKNLLDRQGNTVILKVTGVDTLFGGDKMGDAKIWQRLKLLDPDSGKSALLSDMVIQNDQLFLLGVIKHHKRSLSCLWKYTLNTKTLTQLATFPDLKAEGLAVRQGLDEAVIVFDGGGEEPSRYTLLPLLSRLSHDNNK